MNPELFLLIINLGFRKGKKTMLHHRTCLLFTATVLHGDHVMH